MLFGWTSFLPEASLNLFDNLEFPIRIVRENGTLTLSYVVRVKEPITHTERVAFRDENPSVPEVKV